MKRWILIYFLVNTFLFSREYYVNQKNPKADDKNPGTIELPFKTINVAIPHLKPGDTVYVRAGEYREEIILPKEDWNFAGQLYKKFKGGKSYGEMISFIAYPGEEVVIKGSEVVTGWKRYKGEIWVKENWQHNSQMVFCDGVILQQIGGKMVDYLVMENRWKGKKGEGIEDLEPTEYIEIVSSYTPNWKLKIETAGSFYYDVEKKNLYIWLKGNRDPNNHLIEASVRPFFFFVKCDYIKISGFKMKHSNSSAFINWPALVIGGSNCIVDNVEIEWADYIGIGIGGNNNTVINSKFNWCGNSGMGGSGYGNRIIKCEFKYNNWRNWDPHWHAGGMKIIPYAHDWLVSDCEVAYNNGEGIWFDAWMSNVTIQNNVCYRNRFNGIFYEIGNRGVIKNNICYENGARGIHLQNSSDILVAHNLCYKKGMSGIAIEGTARKGGVYGREQDNALFTKNIVIWGNLLVDNAHPELLPKGWGNRPEIVFPDPRYDTNFNNFSDYNVIIRTDGREIPFWRGWGTESYNIQQWREKTGNDKHSVVINYPVNLFVDIEKKDFRPVGDAPHIGVVKPIMDVRYDITGFDRVYGGLKPGEKREKFTAGPYEFVK